MAWREERAVPKKNHAEGVGEPSPAPGLKGREGPEKRRRGGGVAPQVDAGRVAQSREQNRSPGGGWGMGYRRGYRSKEFQGEFLPSPSRFPSPASLLLGGIHTGTMIDYGGVM